MGKARVWLRLGVNKTDWPCRRLYTSQANKAWGARGRSVAHQIPGGFYNVYKWMGAVLKEFQKQHAAEQLQQNENVDLRTPVKGGATKSKRSTRYLLPSNVSLHEGNYLK
jgi:hypothetical protein